MPDDPAVPASRPRLRSGAQGNYGGWHEAAAARWTWRRMVVGGGETVVWRTCLYQITTEVAHRQGHDLRVYRHRPDCCESHGRGAEDRCE